MQILCFLWSIAGTKGMVDELIHLLFYYFPMTAFVGTDVTDNMRHLFYITPNRH